MQSVYNNVLYLKTWPEEEKDLSGKPNIQIIGVLERKIGKMEGRKSRRNN